MGKAKRLRKEKVRRKRERRAARARFVFIEDDPLLRQCQIEARNDLFRKMAGLHREGQPAGIVPLGPRIDR